MEGDGNAVSGDASGMGASDSSAAMFLVSEVDIGDKEGDGKAELLSPSVSMSAAVGSGEELILGVVGTS